jgi:hypothetical protein
MSASIAGVVGTASPAPRARASGTVGGILFFGALALVVVLSACSGAGDASGKPSGSGVRESAGATVEGVKAEGYCTAKGGKLVPRVATWNTNGDPSTWLRLAGHRTFCEFESGSGDQTTRISVDLTTLSSPEPTLASIAYLSAIRTTSPPVVGQNPAIWSCANDFDGSAAFGDTAGGGGWVDVTQPVFVIMDECVFADGSAIDAFGLWYHANEIIRGTDLEPLFAYQPGDRLPAVYERKRP